MLFVDDILIFFNGSVRDITKLKNTLSLFIEATYIMCNLRKSTFSYMNLDQEATDWITS